MTDEKLSQDSMIEATRSRAKFSGHGAAKGAGGYKVAADDPECEFLSQSGQSSIINPREGGLGKIIIGAAWENIALENSGFLNKLIKKATRQGVDIDLGCLYELQDGSRGAIQAFGDMFGHFDEAPYISLSEDERTGDKDGFDEHINLNGLHWDKIKRLLVYVYIYNGVPNWAALRPQIQISIAAEHPMVVTPNVHKSELSVCAITMLENVRNGIKLTNHTEYFPAMLKWIAPSDLASNGMTEKNNL